MIAQQNFQPKTYPNGQFPSYGFDFRSPSKRRKEKDFTSPQTAAYVHRIGNQLADKLEESISYSQTLEEAAERQAKVDAIRENESSANIYYSVNQTNSQTGEKFNAYGSLSIASGNRLSPSYQAKQSQRRTRSIFKACEETGICDANRKLIVRADSSLKNFPQGVRARSLVLTSPDLKLDAEIGLIIYLRALALFKSMAWVKQRIYCAYFSVELTSGKSDLPRPYWHSHALAASKWLDQAELANKWTDAYAKACEEYSVEFRLPTSCTSNRLNVFVTDVATYAKKNEISFENAVFELGKYISKGVDLLDFTPEQLAQIEKALSNKRLIEPFGLFNKHKGKSKPSQPADAPLVHKGTQLKKTTAKPALTLVRVGAQMILEGRRDEWLVLLRRKEDKRRAFRREQLAINNPQAVFYTLDGRRFSSSDFIHRDKPKVRSFVRLNQ